MRNFKTKYQKSVIITLFIILVISSSSIYANFTHNHTDIHIKHHNCSACILLDSLFNTVLFKSEVINNTLAFEQNITCEIEYLNTQPTINEDSPRAPPLF